MSEKLSKEREFLGHSRGSINVEVTARPVIRSGQKYKACLRYGI